MLYINDFENFANSEMKGLLAEGKTYHVFMHLRLTSLDKLDKEIKNMVIANTMTHIIHSNISDEDKKF